MGVSQPPTDWREQIDDLGQELTARVEAHRGATLVEIEQAVLAAAGRLPARILEGLAQDGPAARDGE